jgi:U3 small nucleolar RNA-associated protein 12
MFENEETVIPGETNKEATLPSKRTVETVKGAEKLIEALDVFEEEVAVNQEYETQCKRALNNNEELPAKPSHNPLMNIYSTCCPFRYILEVLKRIKSNELEETLLTLPFNYTISLLKVLTQLLERKWEIELLCRSMFYNSVNNYLIFEENRRNSQCLQTCFEFKSENCNFFEKKLCILFKQTAKSS